MKTSALTASALTIFLIALNLPVDAQQASPGDTANDVTAPLQRPSESTDARGAPSREIDPQQLKRDDARANTAAPATTDFYRAAQATYKAALKKAAADHKESLVNCRTLAKAAQKSCEEDADARLKVAKAEAERFKHAS